MKKILFIQHASAFGGSAMSLLYTLQGLRQAEGDKLNLVVALAKWTPDLDRFYRTHGFEVVRNDWIDTYEHTQLVSYNLLNPLNIIKECKQILSLQKARKRTKELVNQVKPDIVHLNSVVLLGSALALSEMGHTFVWHVREPSARGTFGIRRKVIKLALANLPGMSIFICHADKHSWGDPQNGKVIYNFIDLNKFKRLKRQPLNISNVNIPSDSFNILFLGGVNRVKGTIILVRALAIVVKQNPAIKIRMLFAGGKYDNPNYLLIRIARFILPILCSGTYSQLVTGAIRKEKLESVVISLPYITNIEKVFNVSDVLVFPSTRPHFARPVIEAGAMKLPVIGSNLEGVSELIENGVNGFKVIPGDPSDLASKLNLLLNNKLLRQEMGIEGHRLAKERFNQQSNVEEILIGYRDLLG